jgi:thiol-disulfide isomerase/thioredoxin
MTLTYSHTMAIGTKAPTFQLPDAVSGKQLSLGELQSDQATVIMFICNHCPYVKHVEHELAELAKEYQIKGVAFVAISSNDVNDYPQDAPEQMKLRAAALGYSFPYLYDESQEIAKAYQAECTPEFYVFGPKGTCVYHGRFDESSPGKGEVTGNDLRAALDAVLAGRPPLDPQYPSMGCNIKWKQDLAE